MKPKPALPRRAVNFGGKGERHQSLSWVTPTFVLGGASKLCGFSHIKGSRQTDLGGVPLRSGAQVTLCLGIPIDLTWDLVRQFIMSIRSHAFHYYFILFVSSILKLFENIPFGIFGGPEKDLGFLVVWGCSSSFSSDTPGQLDVLWHDCHPLCVDGTQVGVFKESHQIGLRSFL